MVDLQRELRRVIDQKTKPPGSLGRLEDLAVQVGMVQGTLTPSLERPTVLVFAGDHGAARSGISSYPQDVTYQMVLNFLDGGAGISVFCRQNGIDLAVVDAGVAHEFAPTPGLIDAKVAPSTRSYLSEPAMTGEQLDRCFDHAERVIRDIAAAGCNVVGFGEMGIGNSSSASLIMSALSGLPIEQCAGRGAGADEAQMQRKLTLLRRAQSVHGDVGDARQALRTFGGFEIVQMAAAMLAARRRGMLLMIDGFISTVAYLAASALGPSMSTHAVFSHLSGERGHQALLDHLGAKPLLDLSMRLGEGTGCALAYPLIRCAVAFLNDMASFESANVSNRF